MERATGVGLHRSVARASSSACDVMNTIGIQISLHEVMLKSQSVHSWHPYIQNQAIRLMQATRTEKLFGRRETLGAKAEGFASPCIFQVSYTIANHAFLESTNARVPPVMNRLDYLLLGCARARSATDPNKLLNEFLKESSLSTGVYR